MSTKLTHQEIVEKINSSKGKPWRWPSCFDYGLKGDHVFIETNKKFKKKDFRRLDPWGIAFHNHVQKELGKEIDNISFIVKADDSKRIGICMEAFKRRISYLNIINSKLDIKIYCNSTLLDLYNLKNLYLRPLKEILHDYSKMPARQDKDTSGRIEKDFQTFLFGKGLDINVEERTNERLAILGEDFFNLKKKSIKILREFPTGVFKDDVSEAKRILPTEYVDLVTLNKRRKLSIIELKLNDVKLEAISQILDYGLFFRCYRVAIFEAIQKLFKCRPRGNDIICYLVNNRFHDRFDDILRYYRASNEKDHFAIKKVVLGKTF